MSHGTRHFTSVMCTSRVGILRSAIHANVSWIAQSGFAVDDHDVVVVRQPLQRLQRSWVRLEVAEHGSVVASRCPPPERPHRVKVGEVAHRIP